MKKIIIGLVALVFIGLSVWLGYYFYNKEKNNPIVFKTETPSVTNIVKKAVATGSIVPRREVLIKPQVSGVVEALYVEAGQQVKAGQLIAKIRVVQNLSGKNIDLRGINSAQNQLETARVNLSNASIEFERQRKLYEQKMISQQEFNRFQLDFNLQKEAVANAERNLNLVQQSALQNSGQISNDIYSTIDGILLDVPVKVGSSVIERSNFNEGTTIASVADMQSLIFEGKIDESEVGKIKEGMELNLTIGAIESKVFKATLEYIAPKGVTEEGAIKFQIKAQVLLQPGDFIRAGYSANADIVLDKKDSVLAIKESMLQFGKDSVFVEIEVAENQFEKRLVKTGISDGINAEVVSGVAKTDKIKIPDLKKDDKKKEEPKKS
jgi:HlyD family secretion protein